MPTGPVFENNDTGIVNTSRNISHLVTLGDNLVKFHQETEHDRAFVISLAHDSIIQQNRDISNVFANIGGVPLSVSVGYDADVHPSAGDNVGNFYVLDVIISDEAEDDRHYNSFGENPQVNGIQMGVAKKEGFYYLKTHHISSDPTPKNLASIGGIPMALGEQNELIVRNSGYSVSDINRYQEIMFFGVPIQVGMVDSENKYFLVISGSAKPFSDSFSNSSLYPYWNWVDFDDMAGTAYSEGSELSITAGGADIYLANNDYAGLYLKNITGDWQATVKINSITGSYYMAKGGIMVNNNFSSRNNYGGGYAFALATRLDRFVFQYDSTGNSQAEKYSYNTDAYGVISKWVRLTRVGSTIYGYWSVDGITFSPMVGGVADGNSYFDFGSDINDSVDVGLVFSSLAVSLGTISFSDFELI